MMGKRFISFEEYRALDMGVCALRALEEIMGSIVDPETDCDSVAGHLTADDVIKRIEARK